MICNRKNFYIDLTEDGKNVVEEIQNVFLIGKTEYEPKLKILKGISFFRLNGVKFDEYFISITRQKMEFVKKLI